MPTSSSPPRPSSTSSAPTTAQPGLPDQMVVPHVNKERCFADLEGIRFATTCATRALHFSGMFSDIVGHFGWDLIMTIECLSWNKNFLALESMICPGRKNHPM